MRTKLAVARAVVGGYVGDGSVHPALLDAARESVAESRTSGDISDGFVTRCGAALGLVLTLRSESVSADVVRTARRAFARAADVATRLGQHGAMPASNGGLAVELARLELVERPSEPVLCFLSSGADVGVWNVPLYRIFADPANTPRLVSDLVLFRGFGFEVSGQTYEPPEGLYALLRALGRPGAVISRVWSREGELAAAAASSGDDPVLVVRCHGEFPSVSESLEAFASPLLARAGTRPAPLVPVSTNDDAVSAGQGPPRAIGLGFQVVEGRLVGPRDLLADRAFDEARSRAMAAADFMRGATPIGATALTHTTQVAARRTT